MSVSIPAVHESIVIERLLILLDIDSIAVTSYHCVLLLFLLLVAVE